MNPIEDKTYIRKQMAIRRNSLPSEQREIWSASACAKAQMLLESLPSNSFMAYAAFRSELDLSTLIEWGWRSGRHVIVPRCIAADRSMTLHYLRSWEELMPGAYGIMEPNPALTPPIEAGYVPEVVLVPGLAFDQQGGRLGYGGGYYDRFAEVIHSITIESVRPLWLGMSFEAQLIAGAPREPHDIVMDGIITEQDVYLQRRRDTGGADTF
ncbi:5-formyltetrahydrofolate cyclo-ligase [Paenibacillus sp. FSL H8-0548]|nr:5-formyltetrahydrofolate cyclo-ligase [Paenibacillus sp. FSL H8-0548]